MTTGLAGAAEIAASVRSGRLSAAQVLDTALERIERHDRSINAFTSLTLDEARRQAARIDAIRSSGVDPGPLAGVPFAVKDLYDIAGHVTRSGARIHAEGQPAARTATVVRKLQESGAVLLGHLNMEEYAYGFFTDNAHFGRTLNPHDVTRTAGGSSGGSAAAVAAGLVPFSLGSDTNGSIRVPAAFCGIYGLKPTFGRLSRAGARLFVSSFDHVGPFARSVADLAAVYDAMQGYDAADPVCRDVPPVPASPTLVDGISGLRFGRPGGYFADVLDGPCRAAVERVCTALEARDTSMGDCMDAARAAAFVITSVEAFAGRQPELATRLSEFDPKTRYRFLAGALMPGPWYAKAQAFRSWLAEQARAWMADCDVLVMPVSPIQAPQFGQFEAKIDGSNLPMRLLLARFVQPLALLGYPIVVVPVSGIDGPPVGVQLMGRPFEEDKVLRAAAWLEAKGVARSDVAPAFREG
jgi:AtzE family amidohydrolase